MTSDHPLSTCVSGLTRRRFLAFSGVAAAGALAAGATQVRWGDLVAAADRTPLDPDAGVLVVLTLYGGNDGLNTVIPAADPAYQDARADLAYAPEEVLDLGDGLGLNPGLRGLHELWGTDQLAVVRGVGYPRPDRSHFRSMAIWQTGFPTSPASSGWLGRWLDATTTDPLLGLSVDSLLPPMLVGESIAAASLPLGGLRLGTDAVTRAMTKLGVPDAADDVWRARAAKAMADLGAVARTLGPVTERPSAPGTEDEAQGTAEEGKGSSAGGQGQLAAQLDLVAALIEMGAPTRAYSVSLGGFDTHSDERATQQRLLTELDTALTAFQRRLRSSDRGRQVVTMVYSEFGRRVRANGSDGTDHGTAGPVLVLGRGVNGGFHGAEPSLTDLDDGDLKPGVDFRSVYASLLDRVLGAAPGEVLDGYETPVSGLFS